MSDPNRRPTINCENASDPSPSPSGLSGPVGFRSGIPALLYRQLPRLSKKVAARRMKLAGHCHRHRELPASRLVLWEPTRRYRSRGRSALTYVDVLKKDAGAESSSELAGCMENRNDWRLRWKLV